METTTPTQPNSEGSQHVSQTSALEIPQQKSTTCSFTCSCGRQWHVVLAGVLIFLVGLMIGCFLGSNRGYDRDRWDDRRGGDQRPGPGYENMMR